MFKCKKILALVLAIVAFAAVAVPAWADSSLVSGDTGVITVRDTNGYVWLRTGPGTGYGHNNRRLYGGCELLIGGKTGVWYSVTVTKSVAGANGTTSASVGENGFVHQDYVSKKNGGTTPTPSGSNAPYINASSVNMRNTASTSGRVVSILSLYTNVVIMAEVNGSSVNGNSRWYQVSLDADGTPDGYVHSSYVTLPVLGYRLSTSLYECEAPNCNYYNVMGCKLTADEAINYSGHNGIDCVLEYRLVTIRLYCPWCGDNNARADIPCEFAKHSCNSSFQLSRKTEALPVNELRNDVLTIFEQYGLDDYGEQAVLQEEWTGFRYDQTNF